MDDTSFVFKKWDRRLPYHLLMKLDEPKICAAEITWAGARSKGVRVALIATFGAGWKSVLTEARKQCLKYGGRKALGCITTVVCGYFGTASIALMTKSKRIIKCAKVCHSVCSGGLDIAELCATAPINLVEIVIFGRPVILDASNGFDIFSAGKADPIADSEAIIKDLLKK